ncbi:mpv17-like protein 2 isoform 3-T3 [Passerculus sandwichensis]
MLLRSWRSLFSGRLLLLTNTVSCGGLLAAGDVLQQEWHRRKHPQSQLQLGRTGRMFVVGCSLGPLMHYWYLWLDWALPARGVRCLRTGIKKVLIDQLVASPTMGACHRHPGGPIPAGELGRAEGEILGDVQGDPLPELPPVLLGAEGSPQLPLVPPCAPLSLPRLTGACGRRRRSSTSSSCRPRSVWLMSTW